MKDNIFTEKDIKKYLKEQINQEMKIDIDEQENLLNIGLDSLTLMKILSFWNKEGYQIRFSELRKNPYITTWSKLIHKSKKIKTQTNLEINQDMYEPFAMTDVQYSYWIGRGKEQLLGGVGCHGYLEINCADLDLERIQRSWAILFEYHPMLRAKFLSTGKQVIMAKPYQQQIIVHNFSQESIERQEKELLTLRDKLSHRLLNIEEGQVIGLSVSILGEKKYRLHFDIDLLVCDVQSFQIILRDFSAYYAREILPPVTKEWNFASYLAMQSINKKIAAKEDEIFWQEKILSIADGPSLPILNQNILKNSHKFKRFSAEILTEQTIILQNFATKQNVTLATVLLTAYGYVISKWSENKRFLMNVPLFNRAMDTEITNVVADFTNIILVEMNFERKKSFSAYVEDVQEQLQQSIDHSSYSGIQIIRELKKFRETLLFAPVVFSCNLGTPLLSKDFKQAFGEISYMISQTPQVLIDFQIFTNDDGMLLVWDVLEQAFPEGVIGEMFELITRLLDMLAEKDNLWENPLELASLSQEKHKKNIINFKLDEPSSKTLIEDIITYSTGKPNNIAIINPITQEKISYGQLISFSQNLAGFLLEKGIKRGDRVAIIAEREKESIIAMIAIHIIGGTYIPIQASQPLSRIEAILNKATISFVISCQEYIDKFIMLQNIEWIDAKKAMSYDKPYKQMDALADDTAYIIFTSGSTGVPKGVEITHRAALNTIATINSQYQLNEQDIGIGVSAFDFDLSVYDIFGLLNVGAKLVLVPQEIWRNANGWVQIIKEYKISLWNSVPALMRMLLIEMEYQHIITDHLRLVFLSGDWIGLDIPERLSYVAPKSKLIAMGGATEASIWSNYFEINLPLPKEWNSIPYGNPLKNQFYRIVDNNYEDCPDYVKGELWIGGLGVAKSYIAEEKLNNKKFIQEYGQKWYRTGDIGCFWRDGIIEFIGRVDNQIKIRGHRIELGEIESTIKGHDSVDDCIVLDMGEKENKHLIAVLILAVLNSEDSKYNDLPLKDLFHNMQVGDYNIQEDKDFFNYCKKRRKDIILEIVTNIDKETVHIQNKYKILVQKWKDEVYDYKTNDKTKGNKKQSKLLEKFLQPFIDNIADILSDDTKRNNIILHENYISPNELSQQTQGGIYVEKVFSNLIANYIKTFHKESKSNLKILEIGARSVETTKKIINRFKNIEYTLVDSSKYYLKRAEKNIGKHQNIKYIVENFDDMVMAHLQNTRFDLILMNNVLHQFENINELLLKLVNILKNNGLIIFSEMSISFPLEDIVTAFFKKNYKDQRQKSGNMLLTEDEWKILIQSIGYKLMAVYPEKNNKIKYPQSVYVLHSSKKNQQTIIKNIEKFITEKLPIYMIPQKFYCMSSFPITDNGKINRQKLINAFTNIEENSNAIEQKTKTEEQLSKVWESLLNVKVQKNSNYFKLGGDSLLATQLSAEIRKIFNIDFSIETVFNQQTLEKMADYIDEKQIKQENATAIHYDFVVDKINRFEPFPLTDVQQAYWFGRNDIFHLGGISAQCYFEMDCENIDLKKAQDIFNDLIQKHEMLRGVIIKGGQQQRIIETVPIYTIKQYNFINIANTEYHNKLLSIREEIAHKKYDIYKWPLFDIRAAKLKNGGSRIFISFDNILIDGWSMFFILKEWNYLYNNLGKNALTSDISFRDYVLNFEKIRASGLYEKDWLYWKQKIDQIYPAPELPVKLNITDKDKNFFRFHKKIAKKCWSSIKSKIKNHSITPAAFLLSVYAEVIFRWSRSEKFSLNLTHFNRIPFHKDIGVLVGDFTALTIYSIDMESAKNFLARTKIVQRSLWEDLNHFNVSGIEIARYLNKNNNNGAMPIVFTCGLGLEQGLERNYKGYLGEITYGLSQTPQVWLDNQVSEEEGELNIYWDALVNIFPDQLVSEMFNAYTDIIEKLSVDHALWLNDNADLIDLPNKQLTLNLNKTAARIPKKTLIDYFYKTVKRYPNHIAIQTNNKSLSYTNLNEISNQFAKKLIVKGLKPGDVMSLLLPKGWEQIVAILAILKCGAIYLPLNYENPYLRNMEIIKRAEAKGIIILPEKEKSYKKYESQAWILPFIEEYGQDDIYIKTSPHNIAYIIYTSGTTGVPKGVAISHQGVLNTIIDINRRFKITHNDKLIAISDISFDLSVYDIFGMFIEGACLVIPDDDKIKEPSHWLELIKKYHITLWNTVPMYMQMYTEHLKNQGIKQEQSLRVVMLSGDWIPLTIKQDIENTIACCELYGLGGATEASIWSNIFKIDKVCSDWVSIPYGKPLKNQRYYIYNKKMQCCPSNVQGDLYIAGIGLADCYWKDSKNTSQSFIIHRETGERLYKTGDLASYMADGNILFCGRSDNQVKINGFRVELEEIDSVLIKEEYVINAISVIDNNKIISFIIVTKEFRINQVMEKLKKYLPDYMIPTKILIIDSIPLTWNGKVDRNKLIEMSRVENENETNIQEESMSIEEKQMEIIWKNILNITNIKVGENFVVAGGDSLKAIQIIHIIQTKFNVELSVGDFYKHPTIRQLTEFILKINDGLEQGII